MLRSLSILGALTALAAPAPSQCEILVPDTVEVGETYDLILQTDSPRYALLVAGLNEGPTHTKFGTFGVGFPFAVVLGVPLYGPLQFTCSGDVPCDSAWVGLEIFVQAALINPGDVQDICMTSAHSTTITSGSCLTATEPGDYTTFTQGGWGTNCQGNNPGCLRDAHFDDVFPDGLLIGDADGLDGDGAYAVLLTDSAAVADFLPHGGPGGALTADAVDPSGAPGAGVLAGQTVAATLNVAFSDAGVFGTPDVTLGDLVFVSGVADGLVGASVRDVLALANTALAGGDTGGFSASQLSQALDVVNNNFQSGEADGGSLTLP